MGSQTVLLTNEKTAFVVLNTTARCAGGQASCRQALTWRELALIPDHLAVALNVQSSEHEAHSTRCAGGCGGRWRGHCHLCRCDANRQRKVQREAPQPFGHAEPG